MPKNQFTSICHLLFAVLALSLTACSTTAHYPINPAQNGADKKTEYRFENLGGGNSSDHLAMTLFFSGGGTRAAALSHGVLEELAEMRVRWDGRERILLDEIDVISSVSGGSITAAHYGLKQRQHFAEFPDKFLYKDYQNSIKDKIFSLEILTQLWSPTYGRIEIVANKFDQSLFHGATFGDLARQGKRPYLVLNSTDMSSGARFAFTQEQFDLICADLSAIPLARAVAASAAVPVVFSPLTLKNYTSTCNNDTKQELNRDWSKLPPRQQLRLRELRSYLDEQRRPYLHLVDGGLVDNIGIGGSLDHAMFSGSAANLAQILGFDNLRKAVFVIVSAETDPSLEADLSPSVPSMRRVAMALADIPINRNTRESLIQFRETVSQWKLALKQKFGNDTEFYVIEVSLRDIADPVERELFMAIPTTLSLPKDNVDRLRQLGRKMLRESPEMQRLLRDMAAEPHALDTKMDARLPILKQKR
ncbi:MAG: patatin-like phospholipase family protein [Burkholderiaceae bacterium]|nr:patatin-like phospholipase family protein [Burkholderiaceae bacterium]